MADERRFADVESMRPVVRAAFGESRSLLRVHRLAHGSEKGAYRLMMEDGGTALAYVWDGSEDYWQGVLPQGAGDPADPFSHASGLALFEAAACRLASVGARCPEILLADRSRALYPADIAVVEDVAGGSLEALLEQDPLAAQRPLSVLADWLAAMAAVRSPSPGKVAFIDAGGRPSVTSCETIIGALVIPAPAGRAGHLQGEQAATLPQAQPAAEQPVRERRVPAVVAAPPRRVRLAGRVVAEQPGVPPQPVGARRHPLHVRAAHVPGRLVGDGGRATAAQPHLVDQDRAARDVLLLLGPLVDQPQGRQLALPLAAADPRPGCWPRRRQASQSSRSSGLASCQYLPRCHKNEKNTR
jgi:hypothetical protein